MKLIDKIQKAHSNKPTDYSRLYLPTAEIIEQIADDYAIEFAEWIEELSGSHIDSLDYHLYLDNDVKELLEMFKKEKGL
jgi:hypothetical protein